MVAASKPRKLLTVIHEIGQLAEIADAPNEQVRKALQEIIPVRKVAATEPAKLPTAA